MTLSSKAFPLDKTGRVRITRAGSVVRHAQLSVGDTEVELTAGLANRRFLLIKPVRTTTDPNDPRRFIRIGPSGFAREEGTPVWEAYELVLEVGSANRLYALK